MTVFLRCGECDYFPEMLKECVRSGSGKTTSPRLTGPVSLPTPPPLPQVRTHVQRVPMRLHMLPFPRVCYCPQSRVQVQVTFPRWSTDGEQRPLFSSQLAGAAGSSAPSHSPEHHVGIGPVAWGQRCPGSLPAPQKE